MVFGIFPALDLLLGDDWTNPTRSQMAEHINDRKFRWLLYGFTCVSLINTCLAVPAIALERGFTCMDKALLLCVLGFKNGAIGITTAHELIHKSSRFEKLLGRALLVNTSYAHWGLEHTHGHHQTVATIHDPATSRLGEGLYSFLLRVVPQTLISSFKLHKKQQKLPAFFTDCILLPVGWALWIARSSKNPVELLKIVGCFYFQAIVGSSLLEVVNYLEHYGLQRKQLGSIEGEYVASNYELCDPSHSWNSPARLSNTLLFKLQRHSDHHANAKIPYHLLRNFKESPQLPTGYAGMFLLAVFPPLWFHVMDPLVAAVREHDKQAFDKQHRIAETQLKTFAGVAFVALYCLVRST